MIFHRTPVLALLAIGVFLVLFAGKLFGAIDWSWFLISSPIIIYFIVPIAGFISATLGFLVSSFNGGQRTYNKWARKWK